MSALFRILIAVIYLAAATLAQAGMLINSYQFGVPATISFVGCTSDETNLTTYTYTNHATGTAGARRTIVGVGLRDGTTDFSTASMTVGGVSATEAADTADTGSLVQSAIYIIDNPSGTTATIVVTASEAIQSMTVCVWAAYDVISITPADTAINFQTASAALTLDLDVTGGGVAVGMATVNNSAGGTATWTGMNERSDAASGGANEHGQSSADTTTEGTPVTVSADFTGTEDATGATASFR